MKKDFSISINKPCNQNFNDFKSTDKGGYCNSCKKEVIDFRKFNDNEIVTFFNEKSGKTCGLFLANQIKNYSNYQYDKKYSKKKSLNKTLFSISVFSLFNFNYGHSQSIKKDSIGYEIKDKNIKESMSKKDKNKKTIGFVHDELGPLPGAIISVKGTDINTSSNFDGSFIFDKKLNEGDVLVTSFMGCKTKEYVISDLKEIKVLLESYSNDLVMVGEVTTDRVYKSKTSFWQKFKNLFKHD